MLRHPDTDGYLGPRFVKKSSRWSHAVFFRALLAQHSATGDRKIAGSVWRNVIFSGTYDHSRGRDICNLETMLWSYSVTGNRKLLALAERDFRKFNRVEKKLDASVSGLLSNRKSTEHGVTFNEMAKLGAILYLSTGKKRYLNASVNGYRKIDRDQMLIDGVHSSSEHLRGKDPLDSHETCDVADMTWSLGYLLMATGNGAYTNKIERACFNAGMGSVRKDFRSLQYLSCPNQAVAIRNCNHNTFYRGETWMSFKPVPATECCPGNVNRIMPNYAARMWMKTRQRPCRGTLRPRLGDGNGEGEQGGYHHRGDQLSLLGADRLSSYARLPP